MVDAAVQAAVSANRVPYDMSIEYLSQSHDQWLFVTIGIATFLTLTLFILRMTSKIWIVKHFGVDDALAAVCMVSLGPPLMP